MDKKGDWFEKFTMYDEYTPVKISDRTTLVRELYMPNFNEVLLEIKKEPSFWNFVECNVTKYPESPVIFKRNLIELV